MSKCLGDFAKLTLSKVTYAVPATEEYAVLICLVSTPGPLSTRITVNPVCRVLCEIQGEAGPSIMLTSVLHPVVK